MSACTDTCALRMRGLARVGIESSTGKYAVMTGEGTYKGYSLSGGHAGEDDGPWTLTVMGSGPKKGSRLVSVAGWNRSVWCPNPNYSRRAVKEVVSLD